MASGKAIVLLLVAVLALSPVVRAVSLEDFDEGRSYSEVFPEAEQGPNGVPLDWGYQTMEIQGIADVYGPELWRDLPGSQCGLSGDQNGRQSPINITSARYDNTLQPLQIYFSPDIASVPCVLKNNGHSLQLDFDVSRGTRIAGTLAGGPIQGTRRLRQIHFHWGSTNGAGSEHRMNGFGAAAELHFVYWNTVYSNISVAAGQRDGLAVLAVLLLPSIESKDPTTFFNALTRSIPGVAHEPHASVPFSDPVDYRSLLPEHVSQDYFTYAGSLTTPPCYESVTWIIPKDPMPIPQSALSALRTVQGSWGAILSNVRPVQPRNNRDLRASFLPLGPLDRWSTSMYTWQLAWDHWIEAVCGVDISPPVGSP